MRQISLLLFYLFLTVFTEKNMNLSGGVAHRSLFFIVNTSGSSSIISFKHLEWRKFPAFTNESLGIDNQQGPLILLVIKNTSTGV